MSERIDAIKLAKRILDDTSEDPDSDRAMLSRQFLRSLETIEAMHKQLQAVDWEGLATRDLVQANRDEILKKHEEAIRRIRRAIAQGNVPMALLIMNALSLFHPMHAESWCGWPDDGPVVCPKCGGQRIHERLKGYRCPRCE